jgi:hypothetical protein
MNEFIQIKFSAEVITLTVTDCGEEEEAGPSQPIAEQDSIQVRSSKSFKFN